MINIEYIVFKNLLSFGNIPCRINFTDVQRTIITGTNGHGKSTLITGICYALYGKPFRDIKKGGIINNINKSGLLVEIGFSIKNNQYKIIRGIAPNIFEIYVNGVLKEQDASIKDYQRILEDDILNMNYKTFTQIVVLGSSNYTPFMKLTTANRREIVEDILNISIFSRMNESLKLKLKEAETELQLQETKKDFTKKQYKFLYEKFIQSSKSKEDRIKYREEMIADCDEELFNLKEQIKEYQEKIQKVDDINKISSKKKELEGFKTKIESNLFRAKKEIEFYNSNDICPKCHTDITEEHKQKHITGITESINKFTLALNELNARISDLSTQIAREKEKEKENTKINQEILSLQYKISSCEDRKISYNREITEINSEINEIINEEELENLKDEVKSIDSVIQLMYNEQTIMKQGLFILRDSGAKTRIINFYLPLINKTINEYLEKFNFNVLFHLDENFEESCKARNYDSFQYGNFSEGEKLRIDLSLMFTWREIAKRKSSASVNLLFFDEILDSAMDATGIEDFLNIISEYEKGVNFFVISHRDGVDSFFDRHIVAKKENNFSKYVENDR